MKASVFLNGFRGVYIYICIYIYISSYSYIYIYTYIYTYIYICIYVYMYIYIYDHIYFLIDIWVKISSRGMCITWQLGNYIHVVFFHYISVHVHMVFFTIFMWFFSLYSILIWKIIGFDPYPLLNSQRTLVDSTPKNILVPCIRGQTA